MQNENTRHSDPDTPPVISAVSAISADSSWEPPDPLEDLDLPTFPTDVLPLWLREFVETVSEATQTPPALCGMLVLAAVAVATAKHAEVTVRPDWTEPLNLFAVVALGSGNRKSAVFRQVMNPIQKWEGVGQAVAASRRAEVDEERRILEARLKTARKDAVDSGDTTNVDALVEELDALKVAQPARVFTSDVTSEAIAILLEKNGGRIGVFSPEGEPFELMAGRYSATGSANFEVYLKGHAGDPIRNPEASAVCVLTTQAMRLT